MNSDPNELKRLEARAKRHAAKRGYPQYSDDFAQEALIGALRGWKTTVEQLFINFLRREQGDSRALVGRARQDANRRAIRLDAPASAEESDGALNHELIGGDRGPDEAQPDAGKFQGSFTGREGRIYDLAFLEELSQKEIAAELGLTEGRVSQLLKPVRNRVAFEAMMEAVGERYDSDPEYSKLEVQWIKL